MAAKLRKREEIPAQYKWDLSHIYPDDAAWEAALADVLASGKKFAAWEGKVAENPVSYTHLTLPTRSAV